jgi:hypothetical protein
MKNIMKIGAMVAALTVLSAGSALATPSTQIWIPSTDVQPFGKFHLGIDNYIRTSDDVQVTTEDGETVEQRLHVYDIGLTTGVLPFEKVQMEVGVDYLVNGGPADDYPWSFNAKLGTPEGSLFGGSPALAVGGYAFGTEKDVTNANIVYGLAAKTLPVVGRLSAGYYLGNEDVLGEDENDGVLLSWDRTMSEISDKLWAAVDYQGGDNAFGALSFGVSWAFSPNVSVIFGYDIYNEKAVAGQNTFTTQLDINF